MLALRTTPPAFTQAEAERIARDIYGLVGAIHVLPGERDCNFRMSTADRREYVLKLIDPGASSEAIDCQVRVLRHLAEQDPTLPVQRIYPTLLGEELGSVQANGLAYRCCLMGFLPGQLLAEQTPSRELLKELGVLLARLDGALQGFFHRALAPRLAWDVRRLPELMEYAPYLESATVRAAVEAAAAAMDGRRTELDGLPAQAVHGDCHGHNLLVDSKASTISGILDFGDMLHAPRVLEPAVAMSELLTDGLATHEAIAHVLQGYAQRRTLEAAEIEVLYDLITARHAVTLLLHGWRRQHDPSGARVLARSAMHAARSLPALQELGRGALTQAWQEAAGTSFAHRDVGAAPKLDLDRRHRLMGAGAELFYDAPLYLVRGSGVWLFDAEGRSYLDVYNNVPHVGHTHPTVVQAVQRQSGILATHTRYYHPLILEYAERLTATLPAHLDACIFVNSGSEANDVAWRIATSSTGHAGGVVMEHAYHGITDAVAALTPGSGQPRDPRVVTLAAPAAASHAADCATAAELARAAQNVDQALATLATRGFAPAAFYIDTAITSSGIFDPPPAWAATVEARLRAAGALIIADEVQYGLGRCGSHFWGFARRGFTPDIVTLGKPVANGYPMGVVIANRALIEAFQQKYGFFSTFGGNAVAAAAGHAVLDVLERERLMQNALEVGEYLRGRLGATALAHRCLGSVRGAGLLLGLEVNASESHSARQNAKFIINTLASEARVLIGYEGPQGNILKLRPPMPFRIEHADMLVAAIEAAAARLDAR